MKKIKTKKQLELDLKSIVDIKNANLKRVSDEMRTPSGMSHGEMKKILQGVKVFKSKIKVLEAKIKNEKT
jgi:hypothetical protein